MEEGRKLPELDQRELLADIAISLRLLTLLEGVKGAFVLETPSNINAITELFRDYSPSLDVLRPLLKGDAESA